LNLDLSKKLKKKKESEEAMEGLRSFYDRRVRNADHTVFEQGWDCEEYRDGRSHPRE
jgi:hypothetical protein